ncbi:hypothetical protein P152DRAFT_35705 [Eremomyces bilateralis CBS 781.70]|uniref:Rhodopsin domain-containing protein n=1 Tax=Eremomyces bilateralis CBS 781.70 TaxID=1392243 RepID=A0A6G1G1R8_9PEZI|nr:uncharacterized protein P152DRAFT_35705 [Eremomyces bilateralis CBS 781.70]KAF1811870.1 hypothetical protein P152DRAFT_35705 [Eremomyces bilateralis CBS 781.70]
MVKLIPEKVQAEWPAPNFVNPVTRGNYLLVISLCFTITTILIITGRFYVRLGILRTLYIDDIFIGIAFVCNLGLCVAAVHAQYVGWDRHQWDQRPEWFETNELHMWIIQLLFVLIMTFAKLSSLFLYRRVICATSNEAYKKFVLVTIAVVAGWGIAFFVATLFSCWPIQKYWESRTGEECTDEGTRILAATVTNIVTDLIVVLMPVGAIWRMNRALREKLILIVLVSLGLVACVASIVRGASMAMALEESDDTWVGGPVFAWIVVECNLAIICISVPALRPLARKYLPATYNNSGSRGTGTGGSMRLDSRKVRDRNRRHSEPLGSSDELDEDLERALDASKSSVTVTVMG